MKKIFTIIAIIISLTSCISYSYTRKEIVSSYTAEVKKYDNTFGVSGSVNGYSNSNRTSFMNADGERVDLYFQHERSQSKYGTEVYETVKITGCESSSSKLYSRACIDILTTAEASAIQLHNMNRGINAGVIDNNKQDISKSQKTSVFVGYGVMSALFLALVILL